MKACNRCDKVKPLTDFYAMKAMRDGRRTICKQCEAISIRKWYYEKGGKVGAIFIDVERTGSELRAALNLIAILVSLGLQDGGSLDRYIEILRDTKVGKGGPVKGDERIKMSCSITDYVARHLGVYYSKRDDLAHAPATEAL